MHTVAVIGCGRIANNAHFPAFDKMGNVRVKYACDLLPEKAQKFKDQYSFVENVITDYKVALRDPEVEAVFVLTPNDVHYTATMDALRAGKHVFCEKPVSVHYDLAVEMYEESKKRGKILNIGVCNRYKTGIETLRKMNESGEFGELYHAYCSFRGFRNIPGLGGAFTTKAHSGGGVLIDWGVHFVDMALYVLGVPEIKTVTADTYSKLAVDMPSYKHNGMWAEDTADLYHGTNDVEDFISGYVRTSGAGITINGAWAQNININELYIDFLGTKKGARYYYEQGLFFMSDGSTLESVTPEIAPNDPYEDEDVAFLEAVENGQINRNDIEKVLPTMRVLEELYRSAEQHKEITL